MKICPFLFHSQGWICPKQNNWYLPCPKECPWGYKLVTMKSGAKPQITRRSSPWKKWCTSIAPMKNCALHCSHTCTTYIYMYILTYTEVYTPSLSILRSNTLVGIHYHLHMHTSYWAKWFLLGSTLCFTHCCHLLLHLCQTKQPDISHLGSHMHYFQHSRCPQCSRPCHLGLFYPLHTVTRVCSLHSWKKWTRWCPREQASLGSLFP